MTIREVKQFFELSSINGLHYISKFRGWSRLFWILVITGGFYGSGYLIYTSFYNWAQSPISTTIETLPISKITFPNVIVCPPKNLFSVVKVTLQSPTNVCLFVHLSVCHQKPQTA